ncbi:MAG: endonuclease MutS2 [Fusobacteria bacterium]|nr:MAG: endonuclease MutS2 [Fusobacteriota bacterium]
MNKHSLKVLEFDKVKKMISEYAILEETKEKIIETFPMSDINDIKKELENVQDFMEMLKYDGGIEISEIKNILSYLEKTSLIGTYLDIDELYFVARNLRIFRIVKTKFEELEGKYRGLYMRFKHVPTYKGIEELIEAVIDNNREIKDTASLDLRDIRYSKNLIQANIKRKFDDLLSNPTYSKAIQEKIVTIRDGRHVIPVKTDFKGQIKGIEHDRSSSGQTVFIEPISVVSLNNKLRELDVREREEIRKILLRLTDKLRINLDGLREVGESILLLDYLNAKCSYGLDNKCVIPKLNQREYISIIEGRHPLINPREVVPLTFELGKDYNTLLITGPNTGGKTVALKTAGLLTVMTLSGIPITANEKTDIGYFSGVYADIGDEQSIEQNLSSFSAHLKNIQKILTNVTKASLVLLDELGSGTDPIEGSAFAMAVIDYLKDKKCKSMVSTHYSEVKAHGYNEEGIETASMEFNAETLSPTYRLLMGVPGESNALTIAKRIGVLPEIIEKAKSYISDEDKRVEGMISNIKEQSEELEKSNEEVKKLKLEVEKLKDEYSNKVRSLEKEKEEILSKAYKESEEMMKNIQAKAKALIDKIQKEDNKKDELLNVQKSLNMMRSSIVEERKKKLMTKPKVVRKISYGVGDKVFVKSLKQHAIILRLFMNKDQAQVQAGILKMVVPLEDIGLIKDKKKKVFTKMHSHGIKSTTYKIDLRGQMVDEAIIELESYFDSAVLNGYSTVQVVHGKGTGQLRKGIQEYLKKSRYVKEFRDANMNEGGLGCTVVTLK